MGRPWDILLRYPLAPLLIWQGLRLRRHALVLPEAAGPRDGVVGAGPVLRLLIIGDSSAAGVGVGRQSEALCGQLVARLAEGYRVEWTLWAKTGATTKACLHELKQCDARRFDVVLVALGVNDVTRAVPLRRWLHQSAKMRDVLRHKFSVQRIIVTDMPPMRAFPALPVLLRWVLGTQSERFAAALGVALQAEPDAGLLTLDLPMQPHLMAADGFHPSAATYALWAEAAERMIAKEKISAEPFG